MHRGLQYRGGYLGFVIQRAATTGRILLEKLAVGEIRASFGHIAAETVPAPTPSPQPIPALAVIPDRREIMKNSYPDSQDADE